MSNKSEMFNFNLKRLYYPSTQSKIPLILHYFSLFSFQIHRFQLITAPPQSKVYVNWMHGPFTKRLIQHHLFKLFGVLSTFFLKKVLSGV